MSTIVKGIRAKYGEAISDMSDQQVALAYLRKHPEIAKDKKYEAAAAELMPLAGVTEQGKLSSDVSGLARSFGQAVGTTISGLARQFEQGVMPSKHYGQHVPGSEVKQDPKAVVENMKKNRVNQYGMAIEKAAEEMLPSNPLYTHRTTAKVLEAAGGTAPTIMAGALNPGVAAMQYGMSAGESAAREAVAAGAYDDAYEAFLVGSTAGGLSELALGVPSKVFKILRMAKRSGVKPMNLKRWVLDTFGKQGVKEVAQENIEQAITDKHAKLTYDPDRPMMEGWQETSKISYILGAAIGGSANVGRMGAERKARLQAEREKRSGKLNQASKDLDGADLPGGGPEAMTEADIYASVPLELHNIIRLAPEGKGLPQALRDVYDGDPDHIEGGWVPETGEVWLNQRHMTSPGAVANKVVHEVAIHKGLHAALGHDAVAALGRQAFKGLNLTKDIQPLVDLGYGRTEGETQEAWEGRIGEEWIARKAEEVRVSGKPDAVWAKIATDIRAWLRSMGLNMKLNDLEIAELMEKGFKAAQLEAANTVPSDTTAQPDQQAPNAQMDLPLMSLGKKLGDQHGLEFEGPVEGKDGWLSFRDPQTGDRVRKLPNQSEEDFGLDVEAGRVAKEVDTPMAPATFRGLQEYPPSMNRPPMELWNLTQDIPGHPAGSTVSRKTIEDAGFAVPDRTQTKLSINPQGRPLSPAERRAAMWDRGAAIAAATDRAALWDTGTIKQQITSAETSINSAKPSALVGRVDWKPGTRNADIGGGRHDKTSQELAKLGVDNVIFDPFNRDAKHNAKAAQRIAGGLADTATASSVLNVIKEPENRNRVIQQLYDALKPGGEAHILIHEGNGDGQSKESPKGWQEHRKAETYMDEILQVFPEVDRTGNMLTARKQQADGRIPRLSVEARISDTPIKEGDRISPAFPTNLPKNRVSDPLEAPIEIDYRNMSKDHQKVAADAFRSDLYSFAKVDRDASDGEVIEQALTQMTDNLVWLFDNFEWKDRARHWYRGANKLANAWAKRYKLTPAQVAGVMAGLSPKNPWFDNLTQAERVLDIYHDHRFKPWTKEMEKQARFRYKKDGKKNHLWKVHQAIRGLTLDEVQRKYPGQEGDVYAGAWIRMYDEVYMPRNKRVSIPEGDFIQVEDTSRMGWGGGLRPIGIAVGILRDGSAENISRTVSMEHKVRNFFNNILSPLSPFDITIDTHAVGAAWLLPVGQSDIIVNQNFGKEGASSTGFMGYSGFYPLYHEAYRRAAAVVSEATGQKILPREMQSVTWEAVKALYSPEFKRPKAIPGQKTEKGLVKATRVWEKYANNEITIDEARQQVTELGGGFDRPAWAGILPGSSDSGTEATGGSSYKGELPGDRLRREGAKRGRGGRNARTSPKAKPSIAESQRSKRLRIDPRTDPKVAARMEGMYQQFSFEQSVEGAKAIVQRVGGHVEAANGYLRGDFGDAEYMSRFILEEVQDGLRAQIQALRKQGKTQEAERIADLQLQVTDADIAQASKAGQLLAAHRIHYARWSPTTWVRRYRQVVGDIAKNRLRKAAKDDTVDNSPINQARIIAEEVADIIEKQDPQVADALRRAYGKSGRSDVAEALPQSAVDLYMEEVAKYRKRHGIPAFDAATEEMIRDKADAMLNLPDNSIQRREASGDLMTTILNMSGHNWWDMFTDYWYGNILSGPTTQVKNFRGNFVNLMAEAGMLMALNPTGIPQIIYGMGKGAVHGAREAANIWRTGVDTSGRSGNKFETPGAMERIQNPTWSKVVLPWKVVMRSLKAVDMMFYYPLQEGRAVALARHEAKKDGVPVSMRGRYAKELLGWDANARREADAQAAEEGLEGGKAKRRAREILEQRRPPILMRNAKEYGLQGTYQNDMYGVLGELGKAFQQSATNPKLRWLRMIVPFISVPVNLTNSMLNWTPVGYLRGTTPSVKLLMSAPQGQRLATLGKIANGTVNLPVKGVHLYGKELTDQLAIRDLMAKSTVGTAAWSAIAYAAASFMDDEDPFFAVFGRGPGTAQANETWREAGFLPYSIKIGDRMFTYNDTPAMVPLAIIGGIMDSFRYGNLSEAELMTRVQVAWVSSSGVFLDSTWLQSLGKLWEAKDRISVKRPYAGAMTQIANIGSGVIPMSNAARQIDMIMDPTKGTEIDYESMLLNRVPFARRSNKPDLNVLGEPIKVGPFDQFFNTVTDDELVRTLAQRKLWPAVPDIGHLTPAEHYELLEARAPLMRALLETPAVMEFLKDSPQFMAESVVRSLSAATTKDAAAQTGLLIEMETRKVDEVLRDIYDWQRSRK